MIRVAALLASGAAAACAGPSSTVPTGFESRCVTGPRIVGETEMGVTNEGFHTDTDARIVVAGRTDGGCVGAAVEADR